MINSEITVFAETTFRNRRLKFGIKTDDRRRHMYLIGKTGMGKSTILENMIVDDIRAGRGVAVVDPHGDLAEKIMLFIPAERVKDVIYFNPSDTDFPIAFNIVEHVEQKVRHLVASGLIGVFKKLWADSWGPRLEYILRNAILAVLDYPNSTLLAVIRMLSDKNYRKKIVDSVQDPVVKAFWQKEFAGYADKFASEAVSPIQNKVGQFLSSSLIRNVVGQTKSSIDVRKVMDEGKILIMNLSKGHIGEDNSALLGAMMITKIQLAAMSRVDIPEKERKDFYLYIDEFQNFSTDSFANILSEARKYHLNLIIAHQYIEQLSDEVKAAVFGNVGTMVSFRVGATDAEELVKELAPVFTEEDILNLPKYEFYIKLMIDGVASTPFSARGLMPLREDEKTHNFEKAIEWTRQVYAKPKLVVEEEIMHSHFQDEVAAPVKPGKIIDVRQETPRFTKAPGTITPPPRPSFSVPPPSVSVAPLATAPTPSPQPKAEEQRITPSVAAVPAAAPLVRDEIKEELKLSALDPQEVFKKEILEERTGDKVGSHGLNDAVCSSCGDSTRVPFEPDGTRPVYCKKCLSELKKKKKEDVSRGKGSPSHPDFSSISPSSLAGSGSIESLEPQSLSLSALGAGHLVNFSKNSHNHKDSPQRGPVEHSSSERELEEGEDIIFE
jgi:CxxC-x17-CxxC domain-containing protein